MTGHEWDPEHVVDAERAAELVGQQFPDLRGASVEPLAEGWDNTVHLVDGRWVFRFPRRTIALAGVQRELAVLPVLADRLPLPVPRPELVGVPAGGFPWPFAGARLLPGVELAHSALPDGDRVQAGRQVGAFLRALHETPLDLLPELPADPMHRASPRVRAPAARERLARLVAAGTWPGDHAADALLDEAEPLPDPAGRTVLVHGDLHLRHLLVQDGRACGVIDWGDVCVADPAVDLALAWCGFAGEARTALLDAYGLPVDAERELRARVLAVFLAAALAEYAAAQGDALLLAESLAGLQRAVG